MNGVVESLARRYPEGRLACRRVLAKAAIRAADVAAGDDNRAKLSPAACTSVASSLRLLVATVNPPRMNPSAKPHRAFPLERLADYAARCHRLFALGLMSGERRVWSLQSPLRMRWPQSRRDSPPVALLGSLITQTW